MRKFIPVIIFILTILSLLASTIQKIAPPLFPSIPLSGILADKFSKITGKIVVQSIGKSIDEGRGGNGVSVSTPTFVMQCVISVIFVLSCLFVILSRKYQATELHWAYGALGTILGFWLKGSP